MKVLKSDIPLPEVLPNIATMLKINAGRFADRYVYMEKDPSGKYRGITWADFFRYVQRIAANLRDYGFRDGDKMVIFSRNRLEMLELEQALKASGGVAVPIFAGFKREAAELLIRHSDAKFIAVEGQSQLAEITPELGLKHYFVFDKVEDSRFSNLSHFEELLKSNDRAKNSLKTDADPDEICLNMYTSGTTGLPKCVQLTHRNILSQQAALSALWNLDENDRFLSYLPWHHSFGGIFEKYNALFNGATLALESSYGKEPEEIFANWREVQPTVFFSIPKIYKALVELTHKDKEAEALFFHSGLKFIFTAAAPLPENLSDEFTRRGIPVIEGWGLTETSPCCTLTDPSVKRVPGIVGKPIPGVEIRLDKDNEIQIKGPNVMVAYYRNDEANREVFTRDGWFRTGDIGEITETGIRLIARKDRIFKLSNGEKVIPTDIEKIIEKKCHYVSYAVVTGSGEEYPVALIFPNKRLLDSPDYEHTPIDGCFCPRNLEELSKCLQGCLDDANCAIAQKFARVKRAAIIDDELSIDNRTLTPSMKVSPKNVINAYKVYVENLYGKNREMPREAYMIRLD